jgi:hypothetical protein
MCLPYFYALAWPICGGAYDIICEQAGWLESYVCVCFFTVNRGFLPVLQGVLGLARTKKVSGLQCTVYDEQHQGICTQYAPVFAYAHARIHTCTHTHAHTAAG